ncbi:MAG: O-antigen ligase family protein [Eubacterium sp.]|nr:O-antigen ligase family protein [Eubacterium sp.]
MKNSNSKNNINKNSKHTNNSNKNNKNTNKNVNRNANNNQNGKGSVVGGFEVGIGNTVLELYLTFLSSFYLLYMHDMYFDITITRTKCFTYGTIAFIITAILSYALESILHSAFVYKPDGGNDKKGSKAITFRGMLDHFDRQRETDIRFYAKPWFYAVLFIISQAAAAFINAARASKNDSIFLGLKYAMNGERGRRLGLSMMLLIFAMFIIVAFRVSSIRCVYPILLVVSFYMFYIAYLQHFGTDYRNWRREIKKSQKTVFMSTIGNMNTFGSYICMFLAISIAAFIFTNRWFYRILTASGILAGSFIIMTAKSDNVYLGTGVAVVVLFFVAVKRKKLAEWMLSVFMISVGLFAMSLLDKSKKGNRGHLNGIAELVGNPKIMGAFLILSAVVSAVFIFIKLKKTAFYERIQNKWLMIGVTAVGLMAVAAFVIIGIRNKNELFVFNNRWGEFRGYIWSRSWRVFGKADIGHKLFGYGNETVRDIMLTNYHQEMIDVTKKVYDSCHNILLQRLLTTGIFGLVTFVTLFGSSVRYMFKYSQGRAEIFACAAGASAYFAEAMVNPEQPITTPLFYVLLAVGVGLARYGRTKEKNKE